MVKKLIGKEILDIHLMVRMSKTTVEQLKFLSEKYNISKSEIIRQLIDNYKEENKE